jgi:predicted nucleotidyltransferase
MDLDYIATVLARWAAQHPEVHRIYIFGSRARGDHRPDSDLDIAVELVENLDESGGLAAWMTELKPAWLPEVQALLPFKIDFQRYGSTTPTVAEGVTKSSRLVYERQQGGDEASQV